MTIPLLPQQMSVMRLGDREQRFDSEAFFVVLSLLPGSSLKQIFTDLRNEQGIQTMKLLLADDSGTMRTIQKRCLLKLGLSEDGISEAEDGQQGADTV